MADIARTIQTGTVQQSQDMAGGRQVLQNAGAQASADVGTALQVQKQQMIKQELIDQKGEALMQTLAHLQTQADKAKAMMEKAAPKTATGEARFAGAPPSEMEWNAMEARRVERVGGDAKPEPYPLAGVEPAQVEAYTKAQRQYQVEADKRNEVLQAMVSDPRTMGIMAQYTYSAEAKRSAFASEDIINSMSPTQRESYVANLTAVARAQQAREQELAQAELGSKMALETHKSNLSIAEAMAEADMGLGESSVVSAKSFANVGATYSNMFNTFLRGGTSPAMKAIIGDMSELGPDIEAFFKSDSESAIAEEAHINTTIRGLTDSTQRHTIVGIKKNLAKNYQNGLDEGMFGPSSPFGRVYKALMLAAESSTGKGKGNSADQFMMRLRGMYPETSKKTLKARTTAES